MCYRYSDGKSTMYFIVDSKIDFNKKRIEKVGTYAEYYDPENCYLEMKRLTPDELFENKLVMLIWKYRGAEAIKDMYDIGMLYEKVENKDVFKKFNANEKRVIRSWIWSLLHGKGNKKLFKDKLKDQIAGEFPKKYFEKLKEIENMLKNENIGINPTEIIRSSAIYSIGKSKVGAILRKFGIHSNKTNILNKYLIQSFENMEEKEIKEHFVDFKKGKKKIENIVYEILRKGI